MGKNKKGKEMTKQLFLVFGIILLNQFCLAEGLDTYSQTGKVIDYKGEPAAGATVICYHDDSNFLNNPSKSCDSVYTSLDGKFSFEMSKERSISLIVAYKSGLALGWAGMNIESELSPTIRLSKPVILKGIIVDEKDNPIENADVRVYLRNEMMSRPGEIAFDVPDPENWYSRKTDAQGQFVFNNIPEGSYAIFQVKASGKASICVERDNKSYTEYFTAGRDDIRIVLPTEARIKGQVIDEATGQSLAGVQVKAEFYKIDSFLYPVKVVQTDSNGVFEFLQLESHKYQLSIKDDKEGYGYVNIDVGSGQTIDDVKIMYKKGLPFKVKVYDPVDEAGIQDVSVKVFQSDTDSKHDRFFQQVMTDINGIAELMIPPGESCIDVIKPHYGTTVYDMDQLTINPERESEIEVAFNYSAYFYSGQVVDEQGNPLAGAEIIEEEFGPRVITDANGYFNTKNIQMYGSFIPASADILARHESTRLAALAQLRDPNRTGHLTGKVVLKPAYTIKGKVADPNGKAIPAAYVQLVDGKYFKPYIKVGTDPNGTFNIPSVPQNSRYAIVVSAEGFGLTKVSLIPYTDDVVEPVQMEPIVLLPADKELSGFVLDANDLPVQNALLSVYGPQLSSNIGRPPYVRLFTDKQGRFYYKGVSEEPLEISAKPPTEQQKYGKVFARGGDTDIKIILGQTLYYSRSLVGKKLPTLKDFGIDSIQDGNQVLLCFFDIEQRPSRNCITE
ncbi:MAG: carboxypeptidase regulatory-like domain-containing protein, partial [Sedimentisphaerales bacterium]|nr:carboxypeptidase regulatory-like domain-containing protein [Sedimentisphaerales bacterium]